MSQAKVSVVVHSQFGNTWRLAEAFKEGADTVEAVETKLIRLDFKDVDVKKGAWRNQEVLDALTASDAIVFGSPTYMGTVSGLFKLFAEATGAYWYEMKWKNKLAGGFTTASHASGDKLETLQYMATLAVQHRMLWIGTGEIESAISQDGKDVDKWGFWFGVAGLGGVDPDNADLPESGDLETAKRYGHRIATLSHNLKEGLAKS